MSTTETRRVLTKMGEVSIAFDEAGENRFTGTSRAIDALRSAVLLGVNRHGVGVTLDSLQPDDLEFLAAPGSGLILEPEDPATAEPDEVEQEPEAESAAVAALEVALDTMRNNEPINRAEGNTEQADLEARSAVEIEQALEVLRTDAVEDLPALRERFAAATTAAEKLALARAIRDARTSAPAFVLPESKRQTVERAIRDVNVSLGRELGYSADLQKPARIAYYRAFLVYLQEILEGRRAPGDGAPQRPDDEAWDMTQAVIDERARQASVTEPAAASGAPEILERIDGDDGMYVNIAASTRKEGGFNVVLRDGDSEQTAGAFVSMPTMEAAREKARELLNIKPAPAGRFRYALMNRPADFATLPKGLAYTVEPRPAAGQPHHDMARHGILVAERELTAQEVKAFELAPLIDGPDEHAALAEKVAQAMAEHARAYLEQAKDEPSYFRGAVMQTVEASASGIAYSIGNPDLLVQSVADRLAAMIPAAPPGPEMVAPPEVRMDSREVDVALLEQVAAGRHPQMLEPELAEAIEAALMRYPDDKAIQELGDRAVVAYSNGLMAATQ